MEEFKIKNKETGEVFTIREKSSKKPNIEYQNKVGALFNVPSAAIRSAIQGKGYMQGALRPSDVPSFQEVLSNKVNTGNKLADMYLKTQANIGGAALDMATDPTVGLMALAGQTPMAKQIAASKPAQAFSKWMGSGRLAKSRVKDTKAGAEFATSLRKKFYGFKKSLTDSFGSQIDDLASRNPSKTVDLSEIRDRILNEWDDLLPETKSIIKKNPLLKNFVPKRGATGAVRTSSSTTRTLKETQEAINHFNTKVPKNIKYNNLEAMDFLDDIKASQLDAFPEMANVRAEYAAKIEPWKAIKSKFNFNQTLKAIENNFGGAEGAEAVKKIFPTEMLKEMGGYRKAAEQINKAMSKPSTGSTMAKMVKYYLLYKFGIGTMEKITSGIGE